MSLRDEIADFLIPPVKGEPNYERMAGQYDAARAILTIVDRHEADSQKSKSSDKRPALDMLINCINGRLNNEQTITPAIRQLAIVEAIDANTETMREWVDLLRKQSRIVEGLVALSKTSEST